MLESAWLLIDPCVSRGWCSLQGAEFSSVRHFKVMLFTNRIFNMIYCINWNCTFGKLFQAWLADVVSSAS